MKKALTEEWNRVQSLVKKKKMSKKKFEAFQKKFKVLKYADASTLAGIKKMSERLKKINPKVVKDALNMDDIDDLINEII